MKGFSDGHSNAVRRITADVLADAGLHFVDFHFRIRHLVVTEFARVGVVGAGFVDEFVLRIIEFHIQPDAAAFGVTGRQFVAGLVGHGDLQFPALGRHGQVRGVLKHVFRPKDAGLHGAGVHLVRIKVRHDPRHPGAAAGHVVQWHVGTHGCTGHVAGGGLHIPHMAVLTGGNITIGLVAGEFRLMHPLFRVVGAVQPLAEGALDRCGDIRVHVNG